MKFISWNVNGLRACVTKGFKESFAEIDADFFCLQETKMQAGQLDIAFDGYESYWNYADKKGYSGTAIFTKHKPLSVSYGLGIDEHDHEGRVITLEMETFYLVTCYTPNAQDGLKRLDYRMQFHKLINNNLLYKIFLVQYRCWITCQRDVYSHLDVHLRKLNVLQRKFHSSTMMIMMFVACW